MSFLGLEKKWEVVSYVPLEKKRYLQSKKVFLIIIAL